jgi:hypothetical protein
LNLRFYLILKYQHFLKNLVCPMNLMFLRFVKHHLYLLLLKNLLYLYYH